jgi:hypothetical protein
VLAGLLLLLPVGGSACGMLAIKLPLLLLPVMPAGMLLLMVA